MPLKLFKMLLLFKSLKPEGTLEILEFNPLMLHLGKMKSREISNLSAQAIQLLEKPGPKCRPPDSQSCCSFSRVRLPPQVDVSFLYAEQRVCVFCLPPRFFKYMYFECRMLSPTFAN